MSLDGQSHPLHFVDGDGSRGFGGKEKVEHVSIEIVRGIGNFSQERLSVSRMNKIPGNRNTIRHRNDIMKPAIWNREYLTGSQLVVIKRQSGGEIGKHIPVRALWIHELFSQSAGFPSSAGA